MNSDQAVGLFTIFPVFMLLLYLILTGFGIYCLVLFIRLGSQGLKPLIFILMRKQIGDYK